MGQQIESDCTEPRAETKIRELLKLKFILITAVIEMMFDDEGSLKYFGKLNWIGIEVA
jgi:hypothetical protein